MRSLFRIYPAHSIERNCSTAAATFFVFAEDANDALSFAFDHIDGIPVPDLSAGWTVQRVEGIALGEAGVQ